MIDHENLPDIFLFEILIIFSLINKAKEFRYMIMLFKNSMIRHICIMLIILFKVLILYSRNFFRQNFMIQSIFIKYRFLKKNIFATNNELSPIEMLLPFFLVKSIQRKIKPSSSFIYFHFLELILDQHV